MDIRRASGRTAWILGVTLASGICAGPVQPRLAPYLGRAIETAGPDGLLPVIVVMRDQAEPFDLTALRALKPEGRRASVVGRLQRFAARSQRGLLGDLRGAGGGADARAVRPLWIVNAVALDASPALAAALAARDDVAFVTLDQQPDPRTLGARGADERQRDTPCGPGAIHAPDAWGAGYTGDGVVVGVIDTGLCITHPDIASRLWSNAGEIPGNGIDDDANGFVDDVHGWSFETNSDDIADHQGHGSHVSGTVAGDGACGVACGVAPGARVMTLKFWNSTAGESSVWLSIEYGLANGADVLNGSIGWRHLWGPERAVWRAVCENAFAAGVVLAFSAGSDGSTHGIDSVHTPGDVPDMITVGATDCAMVIANFSSRGPVSWEHVDPYNDWPYPPGKRKPTLVAPGVNTLSHDLCDGYTYYSGVAMAVPHVAATAAMMLQANPSLDHYQVRQILEDTAVDQGEPGPDNTYGAGFLDAWAAVRGAIDAACAADFNADGSVNTLDVLAFLNAWNAGDDRADVNGDGGINTLDVLAFLNLWNAGC